MLYILLGILVISIGIFLFSKKDTGGRELAGLPNFLSSKLLGGLLILSGLVSFALTSFVLIDSRAVGHLKRIYAWNELPEGRIIALDGQKGPQARVLGPGFHFMPFVRVLYNVDQLSIISIPDGSYGAITALDGKAMPEGMFIAPAIPDDKINEVLKAKNFITQGWYRGPQETVLKPGQYRLNKYLFKVTTNTDLTKATIIPAGHVGVVKSNVKKPGAHCIKEKVSAAEGHDIDGALSVPLVPRGCIGIWKEPLFPGAYYLNRRAYQVTLVDTRVRTWEYKGGFTKRIIDLSVDQQGNIKQQERTEKHEVPK